MYEWPYRTGLHEHSMAKAQMPLVVVSSPVLSFVALTVKYKYSMSTLNGADPGGQWGCRS